MTIYADKWNFMQDAAHVSPAIVYQVYAIVRFIGGEEAESALLGK